MCRLASTSTSTRRSPSSFPSTSPPFDGFAHRDPPSYAGNDSDPSFRLPPSRFPVAPREEEGHECLPGYKSAIYQEGLLSVKWEYTSPLFHRNARRSWGESVYVILNNTVLNFHKAKKTNFLGNLHPGEGLESVKGYKPGKLLKSFTLQNGEVGQASDYVHRAHTLRVRAEMEQFLIYLVTTESMVKWYQAIQSAIDLAPSLDERQDPDYNTLPRLPGPSLTTAQQRAEQERIIRTQYPQLLLDESERRRFQDETHRDDNIDLEALRLSSARAAANIPLSNSTPSSYAATPIVSRPAYARATSSRLSTLSSPSGNSYPPSLCESTGTISSSSSTSYADSSTSPLQCYFSLPSGPTKSSSTVASPTQLQICAESRANTAYARRCMPSLLEFQSRKHVHIVTGDGRLWKLDWEGRNGDTTVIADCSKLKGTLVEVPILIKEFDGGGGTIGTSQESSTSRRSSGLRSIVATLSGSRAGSRDNLEDLTQTMGHPPCYGEVVGHQLPDDA